MLCLGWVSNVYEHMLLLLFELELARFPQQTSNQQDVLNDMSGEKCVWIHTQRI